MNLELLEKPYSTVSKVKLLSNGGLMMHVINAGLIYGDIEKGFKYYKKDAAILDFNMEGEHLYIQYKDSVSVINLKYNKRLTVIDRSKCLEQALITSYKYQEGLVALYQDQYVVYNVLPSMNRIKPHLILKNILGTYTFLNDSNIISEYDRNSISFNLEVLPNISARNLVKLKYKLIDVDMNWELISPSNSDFFFKYQNLNCGNYKFVAKAVNEDGIESELFVLNFEIKPPFWKTWWFVLILVGITLMSLIGLYVWRISYLKRQTLIKIEKQRNEIRLLSAELTTIRSQMNPHFIFNTLSSIQAKVINAKGEEAVDDISRFSVLVRSVLDFSSREYILLKDEINFIKNFLHLESSRYDSQIEYSVVVSEELDVDFCEIPSLITIPLLENAIKHGLLHKEGKKQLNINFTGSIHTVVIIIEENGIGRERSMEINKQSRKNHKSFALTALSKRIQRINQSGKMTLDLSIEDLEVGTRVVIKISYND